jgi:hypothetical protein
LEITNDDDDDDDDGVVFTAATATGVMVLTKVEHRTLLAPEWTRPQSE